MHMKKAFVCELCGKVSEDSERIAECEETHLLNGDIKDLATLLHTWLCRNRLAKRECTWDKENWTHSGEERSHWKAAAVQFRRYCLQHKITARAAFELVRFGAIGGFFHR